MCMPFSVAPPVIYKSFIMLNFKPFALLVPSNCTVTNKLIQFYYFLLLYLFNNTTKTMPKKHAGIKAGCKIGLLELSIVAHP